jgi:hypothetical protein
MRARKNEREENMFNESWLHLGEKPGRKRHHVLLYFEWRIGWKIK